ncbi:MAG: site-specific integrase [Geobacteraceae bacterium]|nr:site-specific integrase [Geobacteraceae bacterium]
MSKSYLLATPANWFFRRKVPDELRTVLGRRELKVSLQTGSKQTALKRARVLAYKTDLIFETLRGSTMAGERIDIPGLTELIAESTVTMPGGASVHRKVEMSEEEFKALITAKSANPEIAANLLQQVGNILHPAEVSTVTVPAENTPIPVASVTPAVAHPAPVPAIIEAEEDAETLTREMKLSAAIDGYMEHGKEMGKWKNTKDADDVRSDLTLLIEVLGDLSLVIVTPQRALSFSKTLRKLPSRRKTRPLYKGRTIRDLVSDPSIPKEDLLEISTYNSIIGNCSALFAWAFKGVYNPFSDSKQKDRRLKHRLRNQFLSADLLKIFSHEIFTGKKPNRTYQYWTPLIALLSGMRQTEIAQIQLSDIEIRDGVYGVSVDDEAEGHTIKTETSRRFVPIHHDLIRLGFKNRVDYLISRGETRLFPELYLWETDPNRNKPDEKVYVGQTISKWFNGPRRFLDSLGITDKKLVFHSFRKNFITEMVKKKIPKEERVAIVGHEGEDTHDIYIAEYDYPKLKENVDLVDFSHVLQNVVPWNINWR